MEEGCAWRGACVAGRHVWQGVCIAEVGVDGRGGMHGREGCEWWGMEACVA